MNLIPKFDVEYVKVIELFIKQKIKESKANGVIIGLSCGLDSATITKLCADILGKEKVLALIMPYSSESNTEDSVRFSKELGINYKIIDIKNIVDSVLSAKEDIKDVKLIGNVKARVRMILLYTYANVDNLLVVGTSNKSELLVGYFTKFGDGGSDILPIGDLYKTQVRELASHLKIPNKIISRTPSAGLFEGQRDEDELCMKYEQLDKILFGLELKLNPSEISEELGIEHSEVERIQDLAHKSVHKRKTPIIAKVGLRTVGIDWRETTGMGE